MSPVEYPVILEREQAFAIAERLLTLAAGIETLEKSLGLESEAPLGRYTLGEAINEHGSYAHAEMMLCRQASHDLANMADQIETPAHSRARKILEDMSLVIRLVASKYAVMLRELSAAKKARGRGSARATDSDHQNAAHVQPLPRLRRCAGPCHGRKNTCPVSN